MQSASLKNIYRKKEKIHAAFRTYNLIRCPSINHQVLVPQDSTYFETKIAFYSFKHYCKHTIHPYNCTHNTHTHTHTHTHTVPPPPPTIMIIIRCYSISILYNKNTHPILTSTLEQKFAMYIKFDEISEQ
jgi:hypothetical protein